MASAATGSFRHFSVDKYRDSACTSRKHSQSRAVVEQNLNFQPNGRLRSVPNLRTLAPTNRSPVPQKLSLQKKCFNGRLHCTARFQGNEGGKESVEVDEDDSDSAKVSTLEASKAIGGTRKCETAADGVSRRLVVGATAISAQAVSLFYFVERAQANTIFDVFSGLGKQLHLDGGREARREELKRKEEAEAARIKAEEEESVKIKAEEEAAKVKEMEEEAARIKLEEEEAAKKKAEEVKAAQIKAEEEAAKKKAEEEEAARVKAEEEAAKKKAEEEEAARVKAEEEAAKKKAEEEEAARVNAEEEAAKEKTEEEEAAKEVEGGEAASIKAEEDAAVVEELPVEPTVVEEELTVEIMVEDEAPTAAPKVDEVEIIVLEVEEPL